MGSLTETLFSGLSVVIGPCPYPPRFPRPSGTLSGPRGPTDPPPSLLGPPPSPPLSCFPAPGSLSLVTAPESLFHFPNPDLFLLPTPLLILLPCISPCGPSPGLYFLHLCLQVSLWFCRYITLLPFPCPAFSPAILSLCPQPPHPSGVAPHFQKLRPLTLSPPHHGHHFPCHLHANMLFARVVLRDIA